MPSRQDQLHSYQYSLQRVVAALVTHDPDPSRSPLRRAGTTALVSLLIASLAVVGATIYGVLTGQSSANPKDTKVVFQEKGTGARFVFLQSDRSLHPVLNYTSGLLLTDSDTPELQSISSAKLATVDLGATLGIPGAPDSLPAKDSLLTERWSVCTDNRGEENPARSILLIGDKLTDGTVAAKSGEALLIRDQSGRVWLVSGNKRFHIPSERLIATLSVLDWASKDPWPVSDAFENAIPVGNELTAPALPADRGADSVLAGFQVGDLVTDSRNQFGMILADGMADITPMQAKLLQAVPGVDVPRAIANKFGQLHRSATKITDVGKPNALPYDVPKLHEGTPASACMTLPVDPKAGDGLRIDPTVPTGATKVTPGADTPGSVEIADFVHIARGKGVLASLSPSPGAPADSSTVVLITDTGRGFPLANRSLITKLGYAGAKIPQIPSQLVSMVPRGPSLDPAVARRAGAQ
ncbi:type VII secretion protein EccB [Actinoplanes sp. KI2]|uniref:type VII secretion protein EccB n=1 Tax=Actinoplanes sp. KI2 TaxID=2983315 RepID=UPI0021D600A9|nr:type VII secretion protein EccB [Actinoplanes sp. KI2]MCU7722177.1 type VII secretion protein EccB [Actinoplanes sp. KI2]